MIWLLARRNISERLGSLALILSVIVICSAIATTLFLFASSIVGSGAKLGEVSAQNIDVEVSGPAPSGFDTASSYPEAVAASAVETVQKVKGVDRAEPYLSGAIDLVGKDGKIISTSGTGASWGKTVPWTISAGKAPDSASDVVLSELTSSSSGFVVGDQIEVADAGGAIRSFEVSGIATTPTNEALVLSGSKTVMFFEYDSINELLGSPSEVTSIRVTADSGTDATALKKAIEAVVPSDTVLTAPGVASAVEAKHRSETSILFAAIVVFTLIALGFSAFIVSNAFSILVAQRLRTIALLRAIGATAKQAKRLIRLEAMAVGAIGSVVGLILGFIFAWVIVTFIFIGSGPTTLLNGFYLAIGYTIAAIVAGLIVGIGSTWLASIGPARRASRVTPIAALTEAAGGSDFEQRTPIARLVAGCLVIVLGGILAALTPHTPPILGAIVGFVGCVILGPWLSKAAAATVGRLAGVAGERGRLARLNLQRSPKRTAKAMLAIVIGLILTAFVFTWQKSETDRTATGLDQAITADIVVNDFDSNKGSFSNEVVAKIEGVNGVESAVPIQTLTAGMDNFTQVAVGKDAGAGIFAADLNALVGVVDVPDAPSDIPENAAIGLGVGKTATIANSDGSGDVTVTGIGNISSVGSTMLMLAFGTSLGFGTPYIVNHATFSEVAGSPNADLVVLVKTDRSANAEAVVDSINQATRGFPTVQVQTTKQLIDSQQGGFGLFLGMILVAIVLSLLGVANTMLLSVSDRTKEIGLLRAIGMTRGNVVTMIFIESILISITAVVIGTVIGIFTAFYQTSPAVVPWLDIGYLMIGGVVAGVVAGSLAAIKAARLDMLDSIYT